MANVVKEKKLSYWIHSVIVVLLIFGFGMIEPFGSLEKVGMQVLGIFIGLLYGWTFIGFIWPSLLGLMALGFTEYTNINGAITQGFGDASITVFVFFIFIFAAYLEHIGLSAQIANWFISRKVVIGRPWLFTFFVLLVTYILGATVSQTAGIVLMWAIFYNVCEVVGFKKGDLYPTVMLIAIVFASMLGFAVFPFKVLQVMTLGSLESVSGIKADFIDFTAISFLISIGSLALFMVVFRFLIRPDISPLKTNTDHFAHLRGQKLSKEQKLGALFLALFMIGMFAPSFMPENNKLGQILSHLGTTGILIVIILILAFLKIDGKPVFVFSEAVKGVNWDLIIMFAATMPVSHAMSDPEVGVMNFIVDLFEPLFNGMNSTMFIIVFILVSGLLTQVAHNLVLGALFTPIAYSFAIDLGANPILVVTLLTFALQVAIATPGGSSTGALIYVNREWIDVKSAYKYSCMVASINLLAVILVGIPIGHLIYG